MRKIVTNSESSFVFYMMELGSAEFSIVRALDEHFNFAFLEATFFGISHRNSVKVENFMIEKLKILTRTVQDVIQMRRVYALPNVSAGHV